LQSTLTESHRFSPRFAIAATSPPTTQLGGQVIGFLQSQLCCPRGVFLQLVQHPNRVAFTAGPVVLVRDDCLTLKLNMSEVAKGFEVVGDLEFRPVDRTSSLLVPFYRMACQQPYTMYFDLNS
jgi:hypothetical protein